jgi:hypothetical protein
MRRIRINVTTDGSGDATATATESCVGVLYAVQLVDGDLADGVDLTLTCEKEDLSIPLLVAADWNSDKMVYPRVLKNLNTDGTTISGQYEMPLFFGYAKAVIAQGGATKTGAVVCYVVEM